MATRKPLFMSTEGFSEEMQTTDDVAFGKVVLSGVGGVAIDAGGFLINNVADPVIGTDAANLQTVQNYANGVAWKSPARVGTVAALPANTYANGTLGVGATLTANANGALPSIDGVTVVAGNRILVKDEVASANNGIYVVTAVGSAGTPYVLTRATDDDTAAEMLQAAVFVSEGTVQSDLAFVGTANDPIVMGTTALPFVMFASTTAYTASTGLVLVGNDFRVKKGDGIEVVSNSGATNVDISSTAPALQFNGASPNGKLEWKPDTTRGLDKDASGGFIVLNGTNPGLYFTAGAVDTKLVSTGGIEAVAAGLQAKLNGSTISTGASGLSVDHAPKTQTTVTSSGGIAIGAAVYASGNNVVSTGSHNADATARILGVATTTVLTGQPVDIVSEGIIPGVLSGATANTPYYLGATGQPVLVGSVGSAKRVILLGYAVNATDLWVDLKDYGKKA
jgi:hypothetical protein